MTALKLEGFMGIVPRVSDRLLPNMCATTARNTKLLSGEARGFRVPREVKDLTDQYFTVRRVYRIPFIEYDEEEEFWLSFDSRDIDIVRSPLVNDVYNRYYWAGDGAPKYNTFDRLRNLEAEFLLGIPTPTSQPTATPAVAGSDSTRSYVYTFVSAYGEEGAPSPPSTVATGAAGTWNITGMQTVVPDASSRNVTKKRIYRTVSGNVSTLFFFVAEIGIGESSYGDNETDDTVSSNNTLESTSFQPPPTDLEGFVAMPNGFLVGWVGRRLVFSEPYRPHAWPPEYEIGTEFEVVSLAVWGNLLVVGTKSNPYIGTGVSPASFTTQKTDAVMPCLSRRGMVPTDAGVYYPSINGLVLINSPAPQIVTQDLVTKEEWALYNPKNIFATSYGLQYIAFNSPSFGFIFNPTEPASRLIELDRFNHMEGIETDRYTGDVYLIYSDRVWEWDPQSSERLYWRWKSKEFHLPKPLNFGALKIKFDDEDEDVTSDVLGYYQPYNTARFAVGSLNTINGHVIHGVERKGEVAGWTEPENKQPIGGSPLYPIVFLSTQVSNVRFTMFADGEIVVDTIVTSQNLVRLPSGFKRDVYQFELVSNSNVYSVSVAQTGRELANI